MLLSFRKYAMNQWCKKEGRPPDNAGDICRGDGVHSVQVRGGGLPQGGQHRHQHQPGQLAKVLAGEILLICEGS